MTVERRALVRAGTSTQAAGDAESRTRTADWDALRRAMSGEVVLPADDRYGIAVELQVMTYDAIRPAGVAYCQTPQDVRDCLLFAGYNGLHVTPRSGGHCNAGYSTSTGLVIDLSRMNQVTIGTSSVTLGAGVQAIDALTDLAPHGIATPNGTCATVAAGGFITGGGIGLLTRQYGAACDLLTAAEVVLANGQIVRSTALEKSDLFWALCGGGGGNFGIVTRFRLRPIPVTSLVSYFLIWPWPAAAQAIAAWQQWIKQLPEQVSANLVVQSADAAPGAAPVVLVSGTSTGTQADLETLVNALTSQVGSAPVSRTVVSLPYQETMMQWWQCAGKTPAQCHRVGYSPDAELPRNVWAMSRGRFFDRDLPADGIHRLLAAFGENRRAGQLRAISIRAMGGKVNEKERTATAFVHRTSRFYIGLAYALLDPGATAHDHWAVQTALNESFEAMDPYSNGESFQNFMDPLLDNWRTAYYGENYARLVRVKRRYDPGNLFNSPQSIAA